ncbi:hypothetical protein F4779DRAFT_617566 [Xylariaceae sp. FL0662B]|nr:hypothetical protein F4779DRAFT_617566 [Xylariaceae sp. FL0662B]
MAGLPPCALSCLSEALANSTCSQSDIACQCTDKTLNSAASKCITMACTVKEALSAQNYTLAQCGIVSSVDTSYVVPMSVLFGLAGAAVLLRLIARFTRDVALWWDDACNISALLLGGGYFGTVIEGIRLGVGNDIWAIPPENLYIIFRLVLAEFDLYITGRFMARSSITLFYIRIFGSTHISRVLWVTFYSILVFWFAIFLVATFQCRPVSHFWNQWDGEHEGWCMSSGIPTWIGTGGGLVIDLWLLVLPLFYLRGLKLDLKKKIITLIMFAVGLVTIALGIIRMTKQTAFVNSTNLTRSFHLPIHTPNPLD